MSTPLVALDPNLNAPQPALAKAARIANGQPLDIFVNARARGLEHNPALHADQIAEARSNILRAWEVRIDELAREAGVTVAHRSIQWTSDTAEVLMEEIEQRQPSLLVVHTHYEPHLMRLLFTPLEWKLIREAPCPVLFAGERTWPAHPPVVAAVDPPPVADEKDPLSEAVIARARDMASLLKGELSVAHAVEYPDESLLMVAGEAIPASVNLAESQRELYGKRMEELRQRENLNAEQVTLLDGSAAHALADHMNALPAGLLVLGTEHKSTVERFLLGSTAEQILYRCAADVLVARAPGE